MAKLTFGQRLKKRRETLPVIGLSQYELAKRAGLTAQQIKQWENDERRPSLESATKLARALGCTVDELGEP